MTDALRRRPALRQHRAAFQAAQAALALALSLAAATVRAETVAARMLLLDGAVVGADVIVVGERGTILRSSDNAQTWQRVATPASATLTAVDFAPDAQHGWAVGHDALILASNDGGRTWSQQLQGKKIASDSHAPRGAGDAPTLEDSFLDVAALDAQRAIAVGAYGLCLVTTDGGKTWARKKIAADDYHLNRITRGPADTLYLAGEHGTLLRSLDRGAKWTPIPAPYDGSFYGVLPLDKRTLIAHGLRGRVYRSTDDGASWQQIATPEPVLLAAAVKLRSNFILLAGQARTLLLSRDYGQSFSAVPAPPATAVAALLELPDGNLLALGEAGATILPKP
ncbi:MAG TPA: YCF48-related protein [Opitutaceae bacterium]|nr:YCF48-related protein [Opitutaceae bacterium]